MIRTIICNKCGKEGRFPYRLTWIYDEKSCRTCHNYTEEKKKYYFCSEKCLKEFVNTFVDHKHQWVHYSYSGVVVKKGKVMGRYEVCEICDLFKFNKDFRASEIEALGGGTNG